MPQVPYEPYTTAQPQGGSERIQVQTPGAAFGENIGAALQNVGSTTQKVGDELWNRAIALQELRNEADARNAQTDFATQVATMHEDWKSNNMGKNASDTLQKQLADEAQLREKIGSTLSSPMARRHYDADTLPFLQRNVFSAAQHAATENKQYNVGAAAGTVEGAKNNFTNPKDEAEVNHRLGMIKLGIISQGNMLGWSPEKTTAAIQFETSKLRANQISSVALTDPTYGFNLLDKAKANNEIDNTDARAVEATLRTQNRAIGGDILAQQIYKEGGSLEEMERKAEERSPGLAHGDDTEFTRHVVNGIRSYQMIERREATIQKNTDAQTVLDAVHNHPEWTTERQLLADPQAGAALHAAQAKGAFPHGAQGLIDANNNDRLNQQNDANYDALRGMALRDRPGFLNKTAQDLHDIQLSKVQRGDIIALRKQLVKEPIDDPRVAQALKGLRQTHDTEMRDLGLFKEPGKDADKSTIDNYDRFLGSLSGALDEWAANNPGRARPTPEEFEKDIAKPLLHTHKEPWMWFWHKDVGSFNQAIPQETLDKARSSMTNDAQSMGMPQEFSDREIIREIQRQQWKQFYSGQKETDSGGTTTVTKSR